MAHLYKSRLQTLAQKRNIPLPTYAIETQGPPHARLFKAQVTIDGNTYAGPSFSSTLKDAEHEAAKIAFMALSQDGAQEDECLYKSLLQELAQKRGLALPIYVTNKAGPPHMPCFVSTVEISGESYAGENARTKKQAEMNAAKVAYTALAGGGPRANKSTAISNTVGNSSSSSGSSILQTVTTHKNEPATSKVQTIINSQASYTIPNDPEKAKGYLELKGLQDVIEKNKMTLAPVTIDQLQPTSTPNQPQPTSTPKQPQPTFTPKQPQPTSTPNVVDFAKPDIKQKNHEIQAGEGSGSNGNIITTSFNEAASNPVKDSGSAKPSPNVVDVPKPSINLTSHVIPAAEGPGSDGKKIQAFVNEATINIVMGLGSTMPHSIKIVIRPHVQGMTYDGPIQVADEEWVAMKVTLDDATQDKVV